MPSNARSVCPDAAPGRLRRAHFTCRAGQRPWLHVAQALCDHTGRGDVADLLEKHHVGGEGSSQLMLVVVRQPLAEGDYTLQDAAGARELLAALQGNGEGEEKF